MPLTETQAAEAAAELLELRDAERERLGPFYAYYRGVQGLPAVPRGVPKAVREMADMARVNLIRLPVDILAQSLFVDGFRADAADTPAAQEGADNAGPLEKVWDALQANRFDSRQIGVHRAAFIFGVSYVVVAPGDPVPVVRGVSPLNMTTLYPTDDPTWPEVALETMTDGTFRLMDSEAFYWLELEEPEAGSGQAPRPVVVRDGIKPHEATDTPVVRYLNAEDLDGDPASEVEPLIPLQNQLDVTTFELLVAQHYQSFRQRYVLGWSTKDENEKAKAAASRLWTFDDPDVKVGEFGQVDITGYTESRQTTVELLATISQTPAHHLLGKVVNLAAEALAAAESGHRRKITERETTLGESHEQTSDLVAKFLGLELPPTTQVRWRDTEARSLSQTVDALGKMAEMLGVPVELLWERVPGMTQQDVETAKALVAEGDSLGRLTDLLGGQAAPPAPPAPGGPPAPAPGLLG